MRKKQIYITRKIHCTLQIICYYKIFSSWKSLLSLFQIQKYLDNIQEVILLTNSCCRENRYYNSILSFFKLSSDWLLTVESHDFGPESSSQSPQVLVCLFVTRVVTCTMYIPISRPINCTLLKSSKKASIKLGGNQLAIVFPRISGCSVHYMRN